MKLAAEIQNERACLAFSDYLTTQGLPHKVIPAENGFQILAEEQIAETIEPLFADFQSNPNQDKYLSASWQVNKTFTISQSWGLKRIWQANGWFTKVVTVICLSIFVLSSMGYFQFIFETLSFGIQNNEYYRLITPAFMHLSVMHLIFNLGWWWYFGGLIERHINSQYLIAIFVVSALMSNTVQAALVNSNFAGLSGVVYALAGFIWFTGKLLPQSPVYLPNNIFVFLVIWMVLGFMEILPINMANWAHLFGLLSGLVLAWFYTKKAR